MIDPTPSRTSTRSHDIRGLRPKARKKHRSRRIRKILACIAGLAILGAVSSFWLFAKATTISSELNSARKLVPLIEQSIRDNQPENTAKLVTDLRAHTAAAREAADDPIWTLAAATPILGGNFTAVSEVARAADDVAFLGLTPIAKVYNALDWNRLLPGAVSPDLAPLQSASPAITSAAHAVSASAERLAAIDTQPLLSVVAEPLELAKEQLQSATGALDAAAYASQLLPPMLGVEGQRSYLLLIQNNAEARSSGGIPGALAVLNLDGGRLSLGQQSSASELGVMLPPIPVDAEQEQIYSVRIGKFLQDVNLTPDFPTAASTAQAMWERKTGQRVDGVISIDPIVLSYILHSTGPINLENSRLGSLTDSALPTELTEANLVRTLLVDVYAKLDEPQLQDAYFAGVAQEVFTTLSNGKGEAKGLIEGLIRGTDEGRVSLWSSRGAEQSVIARYALGGSITGPAVTPAQFGVYFNDGTGAKMDYYVKRTVQLIKECPRDGYEQTTVRITSTNTAPADAADSLPAYVTGDGNFGVPPGSIQTNVVAYGPVQANVETAKLDGQKAQFAPYLHSKRPVGVIAIRLAPGESRSVDFAFGKIVQHTEPNVVVTPTVQPVKEVILPTESSSCS